MKMIVCNFFGWKFDFTLAKFPGEIETHSEKRTSERITIQYCSCRLPYRKLSIQKFFVFASFLYDTTLAVAVVTSQRAKCIQQNQF